jgi:Anthranilate/para-aminobenzoate synthases component I
VRAHIAAGDCYQVNLTTRLRSLPGPELFTLFAALAAAQPGGYAVFLRDAGALSVSPELFFSFSPASGVLRTQPMKGTAARGGDRRRTPPRPPPSAGAPRTAPRTS